MTRLAYMKNYLAILALLLCCSLIAHEKAPKSNPVPWPKELTERKQIAPYYVELLDGLNWLIFWRQMNHMPISNLVMLSKPKLRIFDRSELEKIEELMLKENSYPFKEKYQSAKASEIENIVKTRFLQRNFSGIRSFHEYTFDAAAPLSELALAYLPPAKVSILESFEEKFERIKWSNRSGATNFFRHATLAPLMPWGQRLPLGTRQTNLERIQRRYALDLVDIAKEYLRELEKLGPEHGNSKLNSETLKAIEKLYYQFATRSRLDDEFEKYLIPNSIVKPLMVAQIPNNNSQHDKTDSIAPFIHSMRELGVLPRNINAESKEYIQRPSEPSLRVPAIQISVSTEKQESQLASPWILQHLPGK